MKKGLFIVFLASATGSIFAQLPVSTAPQNKKVVLEEFTGVYCGYCPNGHYIANNIYSADPANVVQINIHSGGYANVATGEPDLKTADGTAIDGMPGMGITGYPAGTVNRTVFSGSAMAGNRTSWANWANTIKAQSAYCNVALQGTLNATTRVLTVNAEVYYTANSPASTNSLSIVLLEDHVFGPQHNYNYTSATFNNANYNIDNSYNHNHVLRKVLTPTFGLTIPATTMGTTFTTSVSYTVPATYGASGKTNPCVLGNLKLAAFVTETKSVTINANHGPIAITNIANTLDAGLSALKADADVCAASLSPSYMVLTNAGSSAITSAVLSYSAAGGTAQTYTFSGNIPALTHTVIGIPSYSFTAASTNTLTIGITSINGAADPVTANNTLAKSMPLTSKIANGTSMSMEFTTDAAGSETSWVIMNEATGATVASGGPYSDLSASGTTPQPPVNFTVTPNTCYKVIVTDIGGDGFNAGIGAGKYVIKANGTTVFTMNGVMEVTDSRPFKTSATAGLKEGAASISNVAVYPNPAQTASSLDIDLIQNDHITIQVMSVTGQVVFTQTLADASAGKHTVTINTENWASGVYNVHISTAEGGINHKLVVNK